MAHPVQTSTPSRTIPATRTARTAAIAIAFGLVLLVLGVLTSSDDVLHAGGVGAIVFGAMAFSLETAPSASDDAAEA